MGQTSLAGPDLLPNSKREMGLVKWGGGCTVQDLRIPGGNVVLIMTPNYHKILIRSVVLIALLSQFASILEKEAKRSWE